MEQPPGNGYSLSLLAALDRLRADLRAEMHAVEERSKERSTQTLAAIHEVREDVQEFVIAHGVQHEREQSQAAAVGDQFRAFIEQSKVRRARQDGVLAFLLFVIGSIGRHWQALAIIFMGLLTILGSVRISIG